MIGDFSFSHSDLVNLANRYVRASENVWIKINHKTIEEIERKLTALKSFSHSGKFIIPVMRFPDLENFISDIDAERVVSKTYKQFLDEITDFKYNENFKLPNHIENELIENGITLRGYQRAGIHWMQWLTKYHLNGILADDMGLGKTLQTILTMRLAYEETNLNNEVRHSLIICPRSVVGHWIREIRRAFPSISVLVYLGPYRANLLMNHMYDEPLIIISTYATVARDNLLYDPYFNFYFIVLDEGTYIKNPQAKRTRRIKQLTGDHKIILSGTPIENRPTELWSLFDFLMPGHLGKYGWFKSNFENPIVDGDENAMRFLANRIKPFILRRLKTQVAKELPEKIEMNEWCELTNEQRSLYTQIQQSQAEPVLIALRDGRRINYAKSILPVLTKLKQVCNHPALINKKIYPLLGRSKKFDIITEKIKQISEQDERVVVFSHFLGMLDLLEIFLQKQELDYIRIDGSTKNRQVLIDIFNKKQYPVALCSTLAAGYGINLTAANHIIHTDRWWNPAIEDQATDRVHRIGQNKIVYVYKILTEGTLEERIDKLLQKKRLVFDKIVGVAAKEVPHWTRDELIKILAPIKEEYMYLEQ